MAFRCKTTSFTAENKNQIEPKTDERTHISKQKPAPDGFPEKQA